PNTHTSTPSLHDALPILRRTKTEVAKDLPPKIEVDKIIDLPPDQRAIYMQVLREVRATVMGEVEKSGVARSQLHILAGLTKLRQDRKSTRLNSSHQIISY